MFSISSVIEHTTELFHSANIAELMGQDAPADIQEALDQIGVTPDVLSSLTPEETLEMLQESGITLETADSVTLLEQIRGLAGR